MLKKYLLTTAIILGVAQAALGMEEPSSEKLLQPTKEEARILFDKNKMRPAKAYYILGQYCRLNQIPECSQETLKHFPAEKIEDIRNILKGIYNNQPNIKADIDFLVGNIFVSLRLEEVTGRIPKAILVEIAQYLESDLDDLYHMIQSDVVTKENCLKYGNDRMRLFYAMLLNPPVFGLRYLYNSFSNTVNHVLVYLNCKKRNPNDPLEMLLESLKNFKESSSKNKENEGKDIDFIVEYMDFMGWSAGDFNRLKKYTKDPDLLTYIAQIETAFNQKYPPPPVDEFIPPM